MLFLLGLKSQRQAHRGEFKANLMYIVSSSQSELSSGSLSQNKAFLLHLFNFLSWEGGTGRVRGQSVGVFLSFQCVRSGAATWLSDLTNTLPVSHLNGLPWASLNWDQLGWECCSVNDTDTHKCPRFDLYHCQKHTQCTGTHTGTEI